MDLTHLKRRGYVKTPTPIEFLPHFSRWLDAGVNVYIKRDDMLPGAGGGNKTRKLDFCIADALDRGCDTLITCGAVQSNHCRLTLSWAVHEGMDCHLVIEERVPGSYDPEASGNNFLFQLLGVRSITVVPKGTDMMAAMEKVADRLRENGRKPYIIPGGASNALGAIGYVNCVQEIMAQVFDSGLRLDHMVVASGSAGTHGGVMAGIVGNAVEIPVTGIGVNRPKAVQEKAVLDEANSALELLGVQPRVPAEKVVVFDDYVGEGYSIPTAGMVEAVEALARTEAILLDPTYTGKAMAGLIDLARKGYFPARSNVLFLHTGGSPALFAYLSSFRHR